MKTVILSLIAIISCSICKAETTFKEDVYPLAKSNAVYSALLKSFCFHPNFAQVSDEGNKRTISALAAFNKDGKATVNWSNYIEFTMLKNDATNKYHLISVTFKELGPSQPCFEPGYVFTIGADKSLIQHTMVYPDLELNFKKLQEAIKSKKIQLDEAKVKM